LLYFGLSFSGNTSLSLVILRVCVVEAGKICALAIQNEIQHPVSILHKRCTLSAVLASASSIQIVHNVHIP
jgi:hypothetical protein